LFWAANSIFGKIVIKREAYLLTLSLIDTFCVPALLYGWEAIGNKKSTSNSLDFVYNSIFIKLLQVKELFNIHSCQFYNRCLPASNRLDLRLVNFCENIKFDISGSHASQLYSLLGNQYYGVTLAKYNFLDLSKISKKVKLSNIWQHVESLL